VPHIHIEPYPMPETEFKLSKLDDHTRLLGFPDFPTWEALASKLESYYAIPLDKIGVSFIDNDNDKITLSSNDELQHFYRRYYHSGDVIKFTVLDLRLAGAGKCTCRLAVGPCILRLVFYNFDHQLMVLFTCLPPLL